MSDEIKKLLSIMNETTTSGSVAPFAGGIGKSMLKRPADSIFAAESVPSDADTGLEAAPKVDSPANFGLWKNSAVIGKEQYGKHGRKKTKVDKTTIYPQLAEAFDPEQEVIDNTRRSRLGSERNAGLNEPDQKPSFNKEVDFGTWHFTINGVPQKKDGKVYYSSSKEHNDEVLAHLRKKAEKSGNSDVAIEVVQGPAKMQESYSEPKDMDDWSEEDWREWDAKVGRVGAKAKAQEKDQGVAEGTGTATASSIVNFINSEINRYYEQDNDFAAQWLAELVHVLTDSRPGWKNLTYDEIMQYFIQYDIDRLLKDGSWEARKIAKVYHNLKQQIVAKFGPKQGVAEGFNDVVKGIKRKVAGKEDPKEVEHTYGRIARSAIKHKTPDQAEKDIKRWEKVNKVVNKEGVAEGSGREMDLDWHYKNIMGTKGLSDKAKKQTTDIYNKLKKKKERGVAGRKAKLDEYSEWDGTGDQDLAAATAANGQEAGFADIEDKTSISETELKRVKREYNQAAKDAGGDRPGAGKKIDNMKKSLRQRDVGKDRSVKEDQEITEEMIADRLKSELDIFKKGTKSVDKSIGKKPADREVQEKRTETKSPMSKKSKKQ